MRNMNSSGIAPLFTLIIGLLTLPLTRSQRTELPCPVAACLPDLPCPAREQVQGYLDAERRCIGCMECAEICTGLVCLTVEPPCSESERLRPLIETGGGHCLGCERCPEVLCVPSLPCPRNEQIQGYLDEERRCMGCMECAEICTDLVCPAVEPPCQESERFRSVVERDGLQCLGCEQCLEEPCPEFECQTLLLCPENEQIQGYLDEERRCVGCTECAEVCTDHVCPAVVPPCPESERFRPVVERDGEQCLGCVQCLDEPCPEVRCQTLLLCPPNEQIQGYLDEERRCMGCMECAEICTDLVCPAVVPPCPESERFRPVVERDGEQCLGCVQCLEEPCPEVRCQTLLLCPENEQIQGTEMNPPWSRKSTFGHTYFDRYLDEARRCVGCMECAEICTDLVCLTVEPLCPESERFRSVVERDGVQCLGCEQCQEQPCPEVDCRPSLPCPLHEQIQGYLDEERRCVGCMECAEVCTDLVCPAVVPPCQESERFRPVIELSGQQCLGCQQCPEQPCPEVDCRPSLPCPWNEQIQGYLDEERRCIGCMECADICTDLVCRAAVLPCSEREQFRSVIQTGDRPCLGCEQCPEVRITTPAVQLRCPVPTCTYPGCDNPKKTYFKLEDETQCEGCPKCRKREICPKVKCAQIESCPPGKKLKPKYIKRYGVKCRVCDRCVKKKRKQRKG